MRVEPVQILFIFHGVKALWHRSIVNGTGVDRLDRFVSFCLRFLMKEFVEFLFGSECHGFQLEEAVWMSTF